MDDFRNLRRAFDLRRPLGDRAEKGAIIHLLESATPQHRPLDLADEQDHRGGIVLRDMHAMRRVGRAWTPRDEADSGSAREAPLGERHDRRARLLTADRDIDRGVMHRVKRREEGLARNAINALDALRDELIDKDLSA